MKLYYDEMDSSIGPLTLVVNKTKLVRIDFGSFDKLSESLVKWASRYMGGQPLIYNPQALKAVRLELERYFAGKQKTFSIELAFHGTDFQKQVWKALYDFIPFGETKSYKDIALAIGNPKAVRAVGGAVNKNPLPIIVPCHRVIGSDGKTVGYNGGVDKKKFLLRHENQTDMDTNLSS